MLYPSAYSDLNMPSMAGGDIDIPGGVYSDLANYWYSMPFMTGGRDKGELRTVAEMLLPVYVYGRLYDNVPEPSVLPGGGWLASANRELVAYLEDRSGIVGEVVRDFLMVTYEAVQAGIIPAYVLEPGTWEDVEPPSLLDRLDPEKQIGDMVNANLTKLMIVAGVVTVAVFLGRAAIKKI